MYRLPIDYPRAYAAAGLTVITLHPITNGQCGCGDPECPAMGKHPVIASWQNALGHQYEMGKIETYHKYEMDCTGHGWVLGDDHVVVDVDPKNGGEESYKRLLEAVPELSECNVSVRTGGGGFHLYYKKPIELPVVGRHKDYPGIDFKTRGGFVVAAGSMHKSGDCYEFNGYSEDLTEMDNAPHGLLAIIERRKVASETREFESGDLVDMLRHISPEDYDVWVQVGMALHHETGGEGFAVWDQWSQGSDKYQAEQMDLKWHSFGKSATVVTGGTIAMHAKDGGWTPPAGCTVYLPEPAAQEESLDTSGIDLLKPPGLVGDIAMLINSTAHRERPALAVGAALWAVGCIMNKMYVGPNGARANLLVMGIAASGSGKGHVYNVARNCISAVGMGKVEYGGITSDTELLRNIYDHQVGVYSIDEIHKIFNSASKSNAASYHAGIPDAIMSLFTESNLKLRGNDKKAVMEQIGKEIAQMEMALEDCPDDRRLFLEAKLEWTRRKLVYGDTGVPDPFFSLIGVSTPAKLDGLINSDTLTSGLASRCMMFKEYTDAPPKRQYGPNANKADTKIPDNLKQRLNIIHQRGLAGAGMPTWCDRLGFEYWADPVEIKCTEEAADYLTRVDMDFDYHYQTCEPEMQSVVSRAYEMTAKVAMILAAEGAVVELEHARYAHALIKRDISNKRGMAIVSVGSEKGATETDRTMGLYAKIAQSCNQDGGITHSTLLRKVRGYKQEDIDKAVEAMIERGYMERREVQPEGRGRKSVRLVTLNADF